MIARITSFILKWLAMYREMYEDVIYESLQKVCRAYH